ncbi:sulfotransferase domain-containing protein [Muricoccus radiodurans]|uniref:sulfotransferase domain-containing protein n=1 Tax=Muricoccus radiodurans TaxID=2231721 RepID=UPI003CF63258
MSQADEPTLVQRRAREEARYEAEYERQRTELRRFVISYPKSGRTWHRIMVGYYLAREQGQDASRSMDLPALCKHAGLPEITYSHNGANFLDAILPESRVLASARLWEDRDVLLIVREPKDTLTSAFFHARHRSKSFDGSISVFIRDPATGIDKLLAAYGRWHREQHRAASFTVISYEAMHQRAEEALTVSLRALGVPEPNAARVADAVEFARFDKMRAYEAGNYFGSGRLHNEGGDPRAAKVRLGVVGGHRSHLSDDDIAFLEQRIAEAGYPFSDAASSAGGS